MYDESPNKELDDRLRKSARLGHDPHETGLSMQHIGKSTLFDKIVFRQKA